MAFTDAEKVSVRRFCGYEARGQGAAGLNNWSVSQSAGLLEYRMDHLSAEEEAVVRQYLTDLAALEAAIPAASASLDTAQAGPWKHNDRELEDRISLFDKWRIRLCGFFGVSPGLALTGARLRYCV